MREKSYKRRSDTTFCSFSFFISY